MAELSVLARPDELLFVAQGTPDQADKFFASRWPEARVVSDTDRNLYAAFGLERVSPLRLLSPAMAGAFWKARQHGVGLPMGDTMLLSGAFVLRGPEQLFAHRSIHPGDHPDWQTLLALVRSSR